MVENEELNEIVAELMENCTTAEKIDTVMAIVDAAFGTTDELDPSVKHYDYETIKTIIDKLSAIRKSAKADKESADKETRATAKAEKAKSGADYAKDLKAGDVIAFTSNGKEFNGRIVKTNAKTVRVEVVRKDGDNWITMTPVELGTKTNTRNVGFDKIVVPEEFEEGTEEAVAEETTEAPAQEVVA